MTLSGDRSRCVRCREGEPLYCVHCDAEAGDAEVRAELERLREENSALWAESDEHAGLRERLMRLMDGADLVRAADIRAAMVGSNPASPATRGIRGPRA